MQSLMVPDDEVAGSTSSMVATVRSDSAAVLERFMRQPPKGLSTLDLLACPQRVQLAPAKIRQEMVQLAKAEMADARRGHRTTEPRVHDMTTLGLPMDPPPLGGQLLKPKKSKFVHGTPVQRRLIAGKLIRTIDVDIGGLHASISAPELVRRPSGGFIGQQDALDVALDTNNSGNRRQVQRVPGPEEQECIALRIQETELQSQLLRVSKKLSRKYTKPERRLPLAAPNPLQALARKWEEQPEATSQAADSERYKLYMAGRFSTQTQLDFYQRELEPCEPATDKHRRPTMHSKYGNALAKHKSSLRGAF
ncbi:hypothetical protein BBJ28_00000911 [Nothophytophthora sp. Chile5]|nr:hypothetical protein BBJ28_00000911 [Nothophytophthora sp. Chile5]